VRRFVYKLRNYIVKSKSTLTNLVFEHKLTPRGRQNCVAGIYKFKWLIHYGWSALVLPFRDLRQHFSQALSKQEVSAVLTVKPQPVNWMIQHILCVWFHWDWQLLVTEGAKICGNQCNNNYNSYLLHYCTEQNPSWDGNRLPTSPIPRMLWNPKAHYRVFKSPRPVPVLSQINPIHAIHLTSVRYILILSSHIRLAVPKNNNNNNNNK